MKFLSIINTIKLLILSISFISCSSVVDIDLEDSYLTTKKGIQYYKGEPFTGKLVQYNNTTGTQILDSNYKEGKLEGEYETFYENGDTKIKTTYKNGLLNGEYIHYHGNGQVFKRYNYNNGNELDYEVYFGNGQLNIQQEFPNGIYRQYTETGLLVKTYQLKNGERDGLFVTYFNPSGREKYKLSYKEGIRNGEEIYYYNNEENSVKTRGNWLNGKKDGVWEKIDMDGKYIEIESYKKGLRDGKFETFSNGEIFTRTFYKNDLLDGPVEFYHYSGNNRYKSYKSGELKEIGQNKNGKPFGVWTKYDETLDYQKRETKTYYKDGVIEKIEIYVSNTLSEYIPYKEGKIHGIKKKFKNGQLTEKEYYEDGQRTILELLKNGKVFRTFGPYR